MNKPNLKRKVVSGFTLVEMAIVLVIIGIILAGVMKGRDIVRGAQVKQFSQQFAQKWGTIAQTYYDKTGQFLNDGVDNGGATGVVVNGLMDGSINTGTLLTTLKGVGIDPCAIVKSKLVNPVANSVRVTTASTVCNDGTNNIMNPWQTNVDGEYTGGATVEVDLVALTLEVNGNDVVRNCVVLYGVPIDVAQGLDTAIDGHSNGLAGSCLCVSDPRGANAGTTIFTEAQDISDDQQDWGTAPNVSTSACQDLAIVLDF